MGQGFLIDTNVVIYALENKLPSTGVAFLAKLPPVISDITRIELLGWPNATAEQLAPVKAFMAKATMVTITEAVILKTIEIKQSQKIKLGDAIIAATAMVRGFTIVTRNSDDFKNIPGLEVVDPFATSL
jgi:predicted nucleic acid-binding protein